MFDILELIPKYEPATKKFMKEIIHLDFGYPFNPKWHADIDNLLSTYYSKSDNILFLAICEGEIIATAAVRKGGILSNRVPTIIKRKYQWDTTCRLARVFVKKEFRGQGIATKLVNHCIHWITVNNQYKKVILDSEFAIEFWKKLGALQIFDEKPFGGYAVHFELPILEK